MFLLFFFNDTATTEIYTLSLHDALPILYRVSPLTYMLGMPRVKVPYFAMVNLIAGEEIVPDRKSTRLNSSHSQISYAVFCLKKKKHAHSCHAFAFMRTRFII